MSFSVSAQTAPLTYKEIVTALNVKLPNAAFETKSELVKWVEEQVVARGVNEPLTEEREKELEDAEASIILVETIRSYSPPYYGYYARLGNNLYDNGQYAMAIEKYGMALELNPKLPQVFLKRAKSYLHLYELEKSRADFKSAIAMDDGLRERDDIKCLMSDPDKEDSSAIFANCDNAIRTGVKEKLVLAMRGYARNVMGSQITGMADLNEAATDPGSAFAKIMIAGVHASKKDYLSTTDVLDDVIKKFPQIQIAYFIRAAALAELKILGRALADLDKSIELAPDHALSYRARGLIRGQLDKIGPAIDDFSKAIEFDSSDYESYMYRAILRHATSDFSGAATDYEAFLRLVPVNETRSIKLARKNLERARKNKAFEN